METGRDDQQNHSRETDGTVGSGTIRFKKLFLQGFKSFPDPTELAFSENICAIVGPNGCGKSNILDALRWVLGEQGPSQLRARSMSDVIFNGSANRKPVGVAEITLVIDCPAGALPLAYEEIEITRRLYRSGDSEYLINRTPCRLKDITDLFLDTGIGRGAYALIEQGRVDALVTARPDERRTFLEQIAGIEKYKVRKKEALSKLASTENNLARVKDVVSEVSTRRIALARQARKAIKYRTIRKERDDMLRVLAGGRFARLQASLKDLEIRAASLENHMARNSAHHGLQSVTLMESRKQVETVQDMLRKTADQIDQVERRIDYAESRIRDLDERNRELQEEIVLEKEEAEKLDRQAADLDGRILHLGNESDNLNRLLQVVTADAAVCDAELQELNRMIAGLRAELADAQTDRLRMITEQSGLKNRLMSIDQRLQFLTARIGELDVEFGRVAIEGQTLTDRAEQANRQLRDDQAARAELAARMNSMRLELAEMDTCRQQCIEKLRQAESESLSANSRLKSLQEIVAAGEGLDSGVKAVLAHFRRDPGSHTVIHGTIADLYDAAEEDEPVIAAALYQNLQDIVAADAAGMDAVCRFLQSETLGRVTVRPPDPECLSEPAPMDPPAGTAPVRQMIGTENGFTKLFDWLLTGVFAAPDTGTAAQAAALSPDAVIVTPCGMRWEKGRARTIGRALDNRLAYRQRRIEIRNLERRILQLDVIRNEAQARYQETDRQWQEIGNVLSELQPRMAEYDQGMAVAQRDLEHLKTRMDELNGRRTTLGQEQKKIGLERETLKEERLNVAEALRLMEERARGTKTIENLESKLESATALAAERHEKLTEFRIQVRSTRDRLEYAGKEQTRLAADILRLKESAAIHREQAGKKHHLLEEGSAKKAELLSEVQILVNDAPVRRNLLESMQARLIQAQKAEDEIAREVAELEKADRQMEREMADIRVARATLDSGLAALAEETGCNPAEEAERLGRIPDESEIEDWKHRSDVLQESLAMFTDVNLAAETEHRELVERSRFLEEQLQDLESAIGSLRNTIQQINRASKARFTDAFTSVNTHFGEIFRGLFEGGEACLELIDPDDPLETGVDIICRPPGKRARTIDLLSGGEKALAALALLLAGFRYKPSPLLFLDEVDAPLDDHNVIRFTRFLKTMAEITQIVMITHNSVTMEIADILYGVTMESPGISKLVSARLSMIAG